MSSAEAEKICHDDNDIGGDLLGLISSFIGRDEASALGGGPQHGRDSQTQTHDAPPRAHQQAVAVAGEEIAAKLSTAANVAKRHSRVIVFSKDRPWQVMLQKCSNLLLGCFCFSSQQILLQLQQLLRSMHLQDDDSIDVHVILTWSSISFERGYEKVMQGQDDVNYLVEGSGSNGKSFSSLLHQALKHGDRGETVMFLTDDCLLLEPIALIMASAANALQRHTPGKRRVFNYLTRLHPGISFCQTRDRASPSPRNGLQYVSNGETCCYDRALSSGEFAYMFDLSGGVYRLDDVIEIVSCLDNQDTCHPNCLELRANQILKSNSSLKHLANQLSAIPSRPSLLILTVNRVQDVYHAPIASDYSVSPESLLQFLERGEELDVEQYLSRLYDASHIGRTLVKERGSPSSIDSISVDLSVLIPVHRGPATSASHAMASLFKQLRAFRQAKS